MHEDVGFPLQSAGGHRQRIQQIYHVLEVAHRGAQTQSMHEVLKKKLEQAYHVLHMEGLAEDTIRGPITTRTDDNRVYIKPWPSGFEEVTAEDLVCVDLDGDLL